MKRVVKRMHKHFAKDEFGLTAFECSFFFFFFLSATPNKTAMGPVQPWIMNKYRKNILGTIFKGTPKFK